MMRDAAPRGFKAAGRSLMDDRNFNLCAGDRNGSNVLLHMFHGSSFSRFYDIPLVQP